MTQGITPMHYKITIKAFFFNAETDYLPYYKHFNMTLDEEAKTVEILAKIQAENENFSYPETNLVFKINDLVVEGEEMIKEVVTRLGTDLQIDPVNAYRSNNGLIINDDDFMQRYALLAPYATEEDLAYYQTLYALHYASETEKFDHDYIGDAVLLLAHRLIAEGSEHKEEILQAIAEAHSGLFTCEYENNLFHAQEHTHTIEALKEMVKPKRTQATLLETLKAKFMNKAEIETDTPSERAMAGKKIAYYCGGELHNNAVTEKITLLGADMVSFSRAHKLSGISLFEECRALALKKAGTTLLDALDRGAEVLVVEKRENCDFFQTHLSAIESAIGRDIPLELISAETLLALDVKVAA